MAERHWHAPLIEALGERAISNRLIASGIETKYVTVHNWKREGRGIPDSFKIRTVIAQMAREAGLGLPPGEFPKIDDAEMQPQQQSGEAA